MDWHDRITVDPNVLVGKPVIKGTRIAVEFVMDLLGRGWSAGEDIQACVASRGDHELP
jgi:uncharacterized protein (DUF433 family)